MSPENKRRLMVMDAASKGAPIESKGKWDNASWIENSSPQWQWNLFDYRIKEGFHTTKKCIGFSTADNNFSHVGPGVWSSVSPVFPHEESYPHKCKIFVDVDNYTHRVVGVSFENLD